MSRRWILWVPLGLFAIIAIVAGVRLLTAQDSDRFIPSHMVGKELPGFELPAALPGRETIRRADYGTGEPRILNVFASWCVPCIAEAPQLMQLSRAGLPIDAVAIRDRPQDVARFLSQWGDPYRNVGLDRDGRLQLEIGSSGVPETYVIDGRGTIRYQHIGPINASDIARILEEYEKARS